MATLVDKRTLDERLARLERLEALIRTDDDAALFRINPLTFASERGLRLRKGCAESYRHGYLCGAERDSATRLLMRIGDVSANDIGRRVEDIAIKERSHQRLHAGRHQSRAGGEG